jgi:quinol monooxygenase YgiN
MRFLFGITPLLLGGALATGVCAQEKEHPIVTAVKANLKDASKPFTILVRIKIKDGTAAKFESAFADAVAGTRKEKGNLAYDLNRSTKNPNEYLVYERWQDLAALAAHLNTPHIQALFAATDDLRDGSPQADVLVPVGH